jgi:molybdopterin molybdotransferase
MLAGAARLGIEEVVLAKALGRVLAAPIVADRDQPPFDASAMDGWAIRRADLAPGRASGSRARAPAGQAYGRGRGRPGGADLHRRPRAAGRRPGGDPGERRARRRHRRLHDRSRPAARQHPPGRRRLPVRRPPAGRRRAPGRLAAGPGGRGRLARLDVAMRPRVAILATGDELVPPGYVPAPDQIFESGSFALAALVEAWGGQATRLKAQADDLDAIARVGRRGPVRPAGHGRRRLGRRPRPGQAGLGDPGPGPARRDHRRAPRQADLVRDLDDPMERKAAACWACPATRPRPWSAPSCSCARCWPP